LVREKLRKIRDTRFGMRDKSEKNATCFINSLTMLKKILFFLYLILITFLSLLPSRDLPDIKLFMHADKVIHLCMYAGFTFLLLWAWPQKFTGYRQLLPLLAIILWGFLMEFLQYFTHLGRTFDLTDELANILGFVPGWIGWKIVTKLEERYAMQDTRFGIRDK